jgi:hypothetical protein
LLQCEVGWNDQCGRQGRSRHVRTR